MSFPRNLAVTGALTAVTAVVGSLASADVQSRWYAALRKPAFQPPPAAFPIAWTTLYASIALTSAGVLTARARRRAVVEPPAEAPGPVPSPVRRRPGRGFGRALLVNLTLNASWSWVFFKQHDLKGATVVAGALAISSADLARRAGRVRPGYGVALMPYAAWCIFATALSTTIERMNPGR
ncbi:hypothetical protein BKD30_13095 [Tersicoccus phoenicis]|uniref:TspO protein n=1 Tax=Tersicoccus phoenicis TaxID=554083 RepID=A0A1R1L6W5_9MICC|nr:TspO/MBR family protein [Tersicoccus phoenicis]OMH23282.1 hypothetical protein BKD30_13095 [Tersicoccus phoenicis]